MKIVIVGAGALGSIIGGHLVRAGEDVTFVMRGERAALLKRRGIVVTGLADFSVPVTVTTVPYEVQEADVLIVTVKTHDTASALASIGHLRVHTVLSLQNGVVKNGQLAQAFGWEHVLGASAVVSGEILPDGAVRFTLNERLALGELPQGTSARVQNLAATFERAGIRSEASSRIQTVEWSKYVLFVGMMGLAVLTRLSSHKYLRDPDGAMIMALLMQEMAQLAARLEIPLEDAGPVPVKTICSGSLAEAAEHLQDFGAVMEERAPTHKISALQDLERGRRLEVEETLGYAVQKGADLDLQLPTLETCYRLIAAVNRSLR